MLLVALLRGAVQRKGPGNRPGPYAT